MKTFVIDLKQVYQADTEDMALTNLDEFEEKWGKKYPSAIASWRNNWAQLSTYFKYPTEIRKIIYTTKFDRKFQQATEKSHKEQNNLSYR